jgi:hypothetical protein
LVSMTHSITNLPEEFRAVIEIASEHYSRRANHCSSDSI